MRKKVFTSFTLTAVLSGCGFFFEEPDVTYLGKPEVEAEVAPDLEQQLRPFGPYYESVLVAEAPTDPVADCAVGSGLAPELAGVQPGGSLGVGRAEIENNGTIHRPFLQDEFPLPVAEYARANPFAAGCVDAAVTGPAITAAASDGRSVGQLIRHAATLSGQGAWRAEPQERGDFAAALNGICAAAIRLEVEKAQDEDRVESLDWSDTQCGPGSSELPVELQTALTPILWAIHDGVEAREKARLEHEVRDPDFWRDYGGAGLMAFQDETKGFNADFDEDRTYLGRDRSKLYGAAAEIANAVQAVDWAALASLGSVDYSFQTPIGTIAVRGTEVNTYEADAPHYALLVDLGGDDLYLDETASNRDGEHPIAIVVDVDGSDFYGYPEGRNLNLEQAEVLPRDEGGVLTRNDAEGNPALAGSTGSERARQGAARNGIAMLFDLGGDDDSYAALRSSQGYAHHGVGVLFDDGGSDRYVAEQTSQGAAQYGLALHIDLGSENDDRFAFNSSQGFGFVQGVGLLFDEAGNDDYECLGRDDDILYASPQVSDSNSSVCQGVGQGFRFITEGFERFSLAGGIGVLIDAAGNDDYKAGVYAQGAGYWQGFGLLSDRAGEDDYDALYYAQGIGVHFGVGYHMDGGDGDDEYQTKESGILFSMGAGNDFSVGVFVNERGNERYHLPTRSGGVGQCGSVGIFVDNSGDDDYSQGTDFGGIALSDACSANTGYTSTAVFVDVGGNDNYPAGYQNDGDWGASTPGSGEEPANAAARDAASGDSGIRIGQ